MLCMICCCRILFLSFDWRVCCCFISSFCPVLLWLFFTFSFFLVAELTLQDYCHAMLYQCHHLCQIDFAKVHNIYK